MAFEPLWDVPPALTGHEGTTYIAGVAVTVVGYPLGRFMSDAMEQLRPEAPLVVAQWDAGRAAIEDENRRRAVSSGEDSAEPFDTRQLLKELRSYWRSLEPFFTQTSGGREIAEKVHGELFGRAVTRSANKAMHGTALTPPQALRLVQFLRRLSLLIDASEEAAYLEPLGRTLASRAAAFASRRRPPTDAPVAANVACLGAHWVQPKKHVPGSWWLVGIRDNCVSTLDVELSSDDLVDAVIRRGRPVLLGLAFCFSAPENYMHERGFDSPRKLWEACAPFSYRDMDRAVATMGTPFRVVSTAPGSKEMRRIAHDPNAFRATERGVAKRTKTDPSSIFDVSGTDSVGALALNGMPVLRDLRDRGCAIWPFDPPDADGITCVEIFPRALWATLHPREDSRSKKNENRRRAFVDNREAEGVVIDPHDAAIIGTNERAFDAFVTATSLGRFGRTLPAMPISRTASIEGRIWLPEP